MSQGSNCGSLSIIEENYDASPDIVRQNSGKRRPAGVIMWLPTAHGSCQLATPAVLTIQLPDGPDEPPLNDI